MHMFLNYYLPYVIVPGLSIATLHYLHGKKLNGVANTLVKWLQYLSQNVPGQTKINGGGNVGSEPGSTSGSTSSTTGS